MAQTSTVDRPPERPRLTVPPPPPSGAPRLAWFDSLAEALDVDLLAHRVLLRNLGLNAAQVEDEMRNGYRSWLIGWVGSVVDLFEAELIWAAAA